MEFKHSPCPRGSYGLRHTFAGGGEVLVSVGRVARVRVKQPLRHGNCLATPLMLQYRPTAQRGATAGIFGSFAAMTHLRCEFAL